MSFLTDSIQHQVLSKIIRALKRELEDTSRLDDERDQLCASSSPSNQPEHVQGPPAPETLVVESQERFGTYKACADSMPLSQFMKQAEREKYRLQQQLWNGSSRRQTLPVIYGLSFDKNAENNVRDRWVEQGIWAAEWGPAWRKDEPVHGPFSGASRPSNIQAHCELWGHEETPDVPPPPKPLLHPYGLLGTMRALTPESSPSVTVQSDGSQYEPILTVRDREASRPFRQFAYQIGKEREWIRDEHVYQGYENVKGLDRLAYDSVKINWKKDGIWDPSWDSSWNPCWDPSRDKFELPGHEWSHEVPDPDDESEADSDDEEQLQPSTGPGENEQQQLDRPRCSLFGPTTCSEPAAATINDKSHSLFGNTTFTQVTASPNTNATEAKPSLFTFGGGSKRVRDDDAFDAQPSPKRTMTKSNGRSKKRKPSRSSQAPINAFTISYIEYPTMPKPRIWAAASQEAEAEAGRTADAPCRRVRFAEPEESPMTKSTKKAPRTTERQ